MACAARRWLARNAARVKLVIIHDDMQASECIRLVSCLPALENLSLVWIGPVIRDDLGCLLEALACCPRLGALTLSTQHQQGRHGRHEDLNWPFPGAPAFTKLRSLTKLTLAFDRGDHFRLADIVSALVPFTGLAELTLGSAQPAVMPTALGQFVHLRSLDLFSFGPLVLEAGCLNLSNLQSLKFDGCYLEEDAQMLPVVTALQRLTCIEFLGCQEMPVFDPQLVQLLRLQRLVFSPESLCHALYTGASPGLFRLPTDMGLLRSSLLHMHLNALGLPHFPLALTQLVALECLFATANHFAELPASITALSRLKELRLGRIVDVDDPLQLYGKRPLDARALGDLSGFPALRELDFKLCEVMLCPSLPGAARHANLATLCFRSSHPAPECLPAVLQLSRELNRLRKGATVRCLEETWYVEDNLWDFPGQAPYQKFQADLEACGL